MTVPIVAPAADRRAQLSLDRPQVRHFLQLSSLEPSELDELLDLAGALERDPTMAQARFAGHSVGMIFEAPSTRTRVSFAAAAWRLGLQPISLRPDELQLGRGETIADTARVLSSYVDALVVRTLSHGTLEALAQAASVPVVNALSDRQHPCQAIADVLTLREEFGTLAGIRVAYIGDGNNVCASLIDAAALTGIELAIAAPTGFEPDPGLVSAARTQRARTAGRVEFHRDPRAAVRGAQAVYTDVWTSLGRENERARRLAAFVGYTVDRHLFAHAAPDAIFLHCLPAHRGHEVTDEVIDGARSRVWRQAANRLHTETALLYWLLAPLEHPGLSRRRSIVAA